MRIGELAQRTGITARTIRYYEAVGLLPRPRRTPSGYRDYGDDDVARLEFIRSAKALGITLDEVKEILAFRDRGIAPCPYVARLIDAKVREIERRVRGLRLLARDLKRLRRLASTLPRQVVAGKARFCHILENARVLREPEVRQGPRPRTTPHPPVRGSA